LRHITGDHPEQSPRATEFLRRVEAGKQAVRVTDVVVFETVYTLERHYGQMKAKIRDNLLPLLDLPGILLPGKRRLRRTFELYVDLNVPFADAYHAALLERSGAAEVVSFDRHFDRIAGLRRIQP
jgi:predicted nucleic acid-binding protein